MTPAPARRLVQPDDEYNRALVSAVHPPDWVNPRPAGRYNLVVIGAGTAGLVTAAGAAGLGAKVALVERHLLGGDCLNYGCVPSKALLRSARAAHDVRTASAYGVDVAGPIEPDFGRAMARLRRLRAGIAPHDSVRRFTDLGIDVFLGDGSFVAPDAVEVGGQRLAFSRAVIATGARAAPLTTPGSAETGYLTNETVFSLTALPRRLVVVGAGPIGCEMAQAFARLGSRVTVVGRDPQLLPREDADAGRLLAAVFDREGIALRLGAAPTRVERTAEGRRVIIERGGSEETLEADEILVAVGRAANVEGLGLEAAGVAFTREGVTVDDFLRTSNARIYAAGDICTRFRFTHAADAMARLVIQNALFFGRQRVSALVIPWATYTDPEIAHVGMNAARAREAGDRVVTLQVPLDEVDRAVLDGDTGGFARAHVDARSGRLLGATIVSRHAGDLIGELSLVMTAGLAMKALSRTIHPYPTVGEVARKLGDAWMRRKLTPLAKGVLSGLLAWRR
ncbi:MAG: mercuric reductase [Vicinamibacteraceae bacterium]|nr:mercuric reductase [Vicinamibacteraceae bacterium]